MGSEPRESPGSVSLAFPSSRGASTAHEVQWPSQKVPPALARPASCRHEDHLPLLLQSGTASSQDRREFDHVVPSLRQNPEQGWACLGPAFPQNSWVQILGLQNLGFPGSPGLSQPGGPGGVPPHHRDSPAHVIWFSEHQDRQQSHRQSHRHAVEADAYLK